MVGCLFISKFEVVFGAFPIDFMLILNSLWGGAENVGIMRVFVERRLI